MSVLDTHTRKCKSVTDKFIYMTIHYIIPHSCLT